MLCVLVDRFHRWLGLSRWSFVCWPFGEVPQLAAWARANKLLGKAVERPKKGLDSALFCRSQATRRSERPSPRRTGHVVSRRMALTSKLLDESSPHCPPTHAHGGCRVEPCPFSSRPVSDPVAVPATLCSPCISKRGILVKCKCCVVSACSFLDSDVRIWQNCPQGGAERQEVGN